MFLHLNGTCIINHHERIVPTLLDSNINGVHASGRNPLKSKCTKDPLKPQGVPRRDNLDFGNNHDRLELEPPRSKGQLKIWLSLDFVVLKL